MPISSQLLKPTLIFYCQGILLVGGGIGNVAVSVRHSMILPAKLCLITLIIERLHQGLAHASTERVMTELRRPYWNLGGRSTIKGAIRNCLRCRRRNCKLSIPYWWLYYLDYQRPRFYHTGVSIFYPMCVVIFQRSVKRYGIMFHCIPVDHPCDTPRGGSHHGNVILVASLPTLRHL